ncbi:MAG: hypothetical protein AB7Q00_11540 [Phycisphaerales bacterium]
MTLTVTFRAVAARWSVGWKPKYKRLRPKRRWHPRYARPKR